MTDFNILYVTSFNKDLYNLTGKKMVDTFFHHNKNTDLLVCYEEFDYQDHSDNQHLLRSDLGKSDFLNKWLNDNASIIPIKYGGKATKTNANKDIIFTTWNARASKWFRKIASLEVAIRDYNQQYQAIIWVDCDSLILRPIPDTLIKSIFLDGKTEINEMVDLFYHYGEMRPKKKAAYETGIIGFRSGTGYKVLQKVFECYTSGAFRQLKRWDDGFVFQHVIELCQKLKYAKTVDVIDARHIKYEGGKARDAINKGVFVDYIEHRKGVHKDFFAK